MDREKLEDNFSFLKQDEKVKAVLLYGSHVTGRVHERSDIDICLVAPESEPMDVMRDVWANLNTESPDYDVHTFEELPLKIKKRIIDENEVVWKEDDFRLQEYFYHYRKIWNDQAKARMST